MPLLSTVSPEHAQGAVKESYDYFREMAGTVPLPVEMMSTSPDILSMFIDTVKYYVNSSNLSFSLLAYIRLLVAKEEHYPYCVDLNRELLCKVDGISQETINAVLEDEDLAPLKQKEVELLKFVMKVVKDPALTEKSDITRLYDFEWTDKDIFEAVYEGLLMVIRGMAFKAFKMSE